MPLDAPVTTATFPWSFPDMSILLASAQGGGEHPPGGGRGQEGLQFFRADRSGRGQRETGDQVPELADVPRPGVGGEGSSRARLQLQRSSCSAGQAQEVLPEELEIL